MKLPIAGRANGFACGLGQGHVELSWNTVTGAVYYQVKRSTTSGGGYQTTATNLTDTRYMDNGVDADTTYYYVVTAVNSAGESSNSNQIRSKAMGARISFHICRSKWTNANYGRTKL